MPSGDSGASADARGGLLTLEMRCGVSVGNDSVSLLGKSLRNPGESLWKLFCLRADAPILVGMETRGEQPGRQRYVLLGYISGQESDGRGAALLLMEDGGELRVYADKRWECGLDVDEREYVRELLKDWREAGAERVGAILDELAELSVGPLRAVESGWADAERLAQMVERFR